MKKWLQLIFMLTFNTQQVWSNDIRPDTPIAIDIYAAANETNLIQQSTLEPPKLSREDNALLHLSIIRDEAEKMSGGGFFSSLFSSENALQKTLLDDISLFLATYGDLPIASDAVLAQGNILYKQQQYEAAAVSWLQTLYEYPASDAARKASLALHALIKNDWGEYTSDIEGMISNVPNGNTQTRLSALINRLYPFDNQEVIRSLRRIQFEFLKRFPNDPHADEVQILLAHNMGAESARSGIYGFRKQLTLYPNSSYRAEAMLAIADLQRLRLQEYEKAASNYKVLIQEFPGHKLTKIAYEHLALTQEDDLALYSDAVKTYQTIVDKYPKDKIALFALQNMATLQESQLRKPNEAVSTLQKLASMFHGPEGIDALDTAIGIAEDDLKDNKLAFEIKQQLVRDYPDSEDAPKMLFEMAEQKEAQGSISESKNLFKSLITKYPNHRLASKAKEKLQAK